MPRFRQVWKRPQHWRWRRLDVPQLLIVAGGLSAGALAGMLIYFGKAPGPLQFPAPFPDARISFDLCTGRAGDNCVIDGDSFVMNGEPVRLGRIDAPELGNPKCAAERELGQRAEARLLQLLNEGPVELRHIGVRNRDRYDRLLRDAVVMGESVSDRLMNEGLAQPWQGAKAHWC